MITISKFLIFLVSFLIMNNCETSQTILKQRIEKLHSNVNNPKIIWELLAEDRKKDMTEEEFIKYFEEHNYSKEYKNLRFTIEKINIKGNKAKVKMRFTGEEIKSGLKFDEILYDYWIFEPNNWYIETGFRTE